MSKKSNNNQIEYLDEKNSSKNTIIPHLNKKVGGVVLTSLVSIILLVVVIFPSSYAFFRGAKEVNGSVSVPDNDYCINNGFTKLSDCILVTENYAKSVSDAKNYITTKGTPNFLKTAPTIIYKETKTALTDENGVISTNRHFTLGKGYVFDKTTGMFTLTEYNNNDLTNDYINYYTCGESVGTAYICPVMYQIKAFTTTESNGIITYIVTSAVMHNYEATDAIDSEVGLYSASDDNGTSYYYRGNVKNNYVSFAGFIWRIVRVNGNGSTRMIYAGKKTSDMGEDATIGTARYNPRAYDPTYSGYMYHENFGLKKDETKETRYNTFNENTSYYFGSGYTFDTTNKKFKLTGNTINGMWKDVHQQAITSYPYTCFSTSATGTCNLLFKTVDYESKYAAIVRFISYSSNDYKSTLLNTIDSPLKTSVDTWYTTNIMNRKDASGKLYTSYLSDEIFCNDRTIPNKKYDLGTTDNGNGFSLIPWTHYGANDRLDLNKSTEEPTLRCGQVEDRFTVSTTRGNGSLVNLVGVITADEVAMAGGTTGSVNTRYYLYTGQPYWTMSPTHYSSLAARVRIFEVMETGGLGSWWTGGSLGVRPVINLANKVLIASGNGTAQKPYTVKLA